MTRLTVFALLLSFGLASRSSGDIITVLGDKGDGGVDVHGTPVNLSDPDFRPGTGGNIIRGQAAIYFFALPTISPGAAITSATLQFQYLGIYVDSIPSIPEFNLDVFGINARPTATIQSSDYYGGPTALSTDTLILASAITPSTAPGAFGITNTNLLNFVHSLYNPDGTPVSSFVTFRVNPDESLPDNSGLRRGYLVAMADNPNPSYIPTLSLTTTPVPTPPVVLLVGMGAACVAVRRRYRGRQDIDTEA
jgi:hypothetical protein